MKGGKGARWSGVHTCGSVWDCPVCAPRIAYLRREKEVKPALLCHERRGGVVYMATFTIPHKRFQACAELRPAVSKSWSKLIGGAPWQRAKARAGLIGLIRALETTRGRNGTHPHLHVLMLFADDNPAAAADFADWCFNRWAAIIERQKFGTCSPDAFDFTKARSVADAADYVSKWGIAHEATMGAVKDGQGGMTPQQVLARITELRALRHRTAEQEADLRADEAWWREYSEAFHGARQLTWSNGLKDLLGVADRSDEEVAADDDDDAVLFTHVSEYGLALLHDKGLWAVALEVAEAHDWDAFVKTMEAMGIPSFCFWPP